MTEEEARKVAEVLGSVDAGCPSCSNGAAEYMAKLLPEVSWMEYVKEAREAKWGPD